MQTGFSHGGSGTVGAVSLKTPYPLLEILIQANDRQELVTAGVDTFAYVSMCDKRLVERLCVPLSTCRIELQSLVGQSMGWHVLGMFVLKVGIPGKEMVDIEVVCVDKMEVCELLLGLNAHPKLGTTVSVQGVQVMGAVTGTTGKEAKQRDDSMAIENDDFEAWREPLPDGHHRWWFRWKWRQGPPVLPNTGTSLYNKSWFSEATGVAFDKEVKDWIDQGILVPLSPEEEPGYLLPWSLVEQSHKVTCPLRLTLDCRELNKFVKCDTQQSLNEVCHETLRDWRKCNDGFLLDIKRAYLQLQCGKELQKFQEVLYGNKRYKCSRLMFGMSSGPKILCAVLKKVLEEVESLVGVYRDDIFVKSSNPEDLEKVQRILRHNGFILKEPVPLEKAKVLGLQLKRASGQVVFERDAIPDVDVTSLRTSLGWVAKINAKYPIQGWSRLDCSMLKSWIGKQAGKGGWEDPPSEEIKLKIAELYRKLKTNDPAQGRWFVNPQGPWRIYTDASGVAEAAILESDGVIVEDVVQIISDCSHINLHELNAVLAGVKLLSEHLIRCDDTLEIELVVDSTCVMAWLKTMAADRPLPKSKSMFFVSVRNRIKAIREILSDLNVKLLVKYVPSKQNPADELTREVKIIGSVLGRSRNLALDLPDGVVNAWQNREVAEKIHKLLAHSGWEACIETIKSSCEVVDLKGLIKACKLAEHECYVCSVKKAKFRRFVSTGPATEARKFNEEVFLDFLKVSDGETRGIIHMVDGYSRYVMSYVVETNVNSDRVLESLEAWRAEFGAPECIRLDRGLENHNQFVKKWCADEQVKLKFGSVGHPQSQTLVERIHRTILLLVRTLKEGDSQLPLRRRIERARYVYLRRYHKSLGMSPLQRIDTSGLPLDGDSSDEDPTENDADDAAGLQGSEGNAFNVGDPVVWKKVRASKDEFGYEKGTVVEVYNRGGLRFRREDGLERTVNQDRVAQVQPTPIEPGPRYPIRTTRGILPERFQTENDVES